MGRTLPRLVIPPMAVGFQGEVRTASFYSTLEDFELGDIYLEVQRVAEYAGTVGGVLTEHRREGVEAARAAGYYEVLGENGIGAVTEALDCVPSTAPDLLRQAEACLEAATLDVAHR